MTRPRKSYYFLDNNNNKSSVKQNTSLDDLVVKELQNIQANFPQLTTNAVIPIEKWLEQFDPEDKLTALKLLEQINYYDINDARKATAMINKKLLEEDVTPDNTFYSYLGNAKSGGVISYLFRQANNIPFCPYLDNKIEDLFIDYTLLKNIKRLPQHIKNLVILDDICCTGHQACKTLSNITDSLSKFENIYLALMVANPQGIDLLNKTFPNLKTVYYKLDKNLNDLTNNNIPKKLREDSLRLVEKYIPKTGVFGKDRKTIPDSLTVFFYNSSANVIPIFSKNTDSWKGLYPRYPQELICKDREKTADLL